MKKFSRSLYSFRCFVISQLGIDNTQNEFRNTRNHAGHNLLAIIIGAPERKHLSKEQASRRNFAPRGLPVLFLSRIVNREEGEFNELTF